MGISRQEVQKVALLGRLVLSEQELSQMTEQLGEILGYVELLQELDTDDVEPMAHAVDIADVFRKDATADSLPRDEALANGPRRDDECYLVPAVLGEL